mgnify:CR=1 FL=1
MSLIKCELTEKSGFTMEFSVSREVYDKKEMEAYKSATNNVQNFEKAADAYKTSLVNMRTGSAATIAENTTALVAAVKEYTDFLTSGKRKVTVKVTQGGVEVNDAKLELTRAGSAIENVQSALDAGKPSNDVDSRIVFAKEKLESAQNAYNSL